MASPNIWPNGFGNTTGGTLAKTLQAYLSGNVYWVAPGGTDAASPAGREVEEPLATLSQALTNVATDNVPCIIFIASGHTEAQATSLSVSVAGTQIIGLGSGSSKPSYTRSGAVNMLSITAAGCRVENIQFPISTAGTGGARIAATGARVIIKDCDFVCGLQDAQSLDLQAGANQATVDGCTFTSQGTSLTNQPAIGFRTGGVNDLQVINTSFTGGTYGWSDYAWKGITGADLRIQAYGISTDRFSDIGFTISGSTGFVMGLSTSSSIKGRVLWTA